MWSHFSCVWLFATLRTIACKVSLSMGFSRVAMPSSRGSSWFRDSGIQETCASYTACIGRRFLSHSVTWEACAGQRKNSPLLLASLRVCRKLANNLIRVCLLTLLTWLTWESWDSDHQKFSCKWCCKYRCQILSTSRGIFCVQWQTPSPWVFKAIVALLPYSPWDAQYERDLTRNMLRK